MIILAVRSASYTHKNRWRRIISKDMRPTGRILESASNIYKVNVVKKRMCFAAEMCPHCENSTIKTRILAMAAAILDWVRHSLTDSDSVFLRCAFSDPYFFTDNSVVQSFFFS